MSRGRYRRLFDLAGTTAVVTGGAGILGRRLCAGLADFGARVAVVDLDGEGAAELARELTEVYAAEAIAVSCDVASPPEVAAMVERVAAEGPIDVLVNNAATKTEDLDAFLAPAENYDLETWRQVMAVNLDGLFLVAREVGRGMLERGRGSIIQTASIYGLLGPDQRIYEGSSYHGRQISTPPVYSASKGGVVGLTRYLATTWGPRGVRVNALVPGGVRSGQNETFERRYGERVPLGRMAEADELVGAVVYLASDASSYVNGQTLVVDGGLSAW